MVYSRHIWACIHAHNDKNQIYHEKDINLRQLKKESPRLAKSGPS